MKRSLFVPPKGRFLSAGFAEWGGCIPIYANVFKSLRSPPSALAFGLQKGMDDFNNYFLVIFV